MNHLVMGTPFITVIAIAYNRKEFINKALASAVNQTLSNSEFEIVVVTNVEIDRKFLENPRIRVIRSEEQFVGPKVVEAIVQSSGDVVCFLEDDDVWDEKKLEVVYSQFTKDPSLGFYHNGWVVIDENDNLTEHPIHSVGRNVMARVGSILVNAKSLSYGGIRKLIRVNSDFNGSSISMRKRLLEERAGYLRRIRLSYDPFLFYSAVDSECSILSDSVVLTRYRVHRRNFSLLPVNKESADPFDDLNVIKEMINDGRGSDASLKSVDCLINDMRIESQWRYGVINRPALFRLLVNHLRFIRLSELEYDILLFAFTTLYFVFPSVAITLLAKAYPEQVPQISK